MKKLFLTFVILILSSSIPTMGEQINPAYPGGEEAMQKFIAENLKYPEIAKENGIEGVVEVRAMVTPQGKLTDLKIVRMVDPDLETEAIRIVGLMPIWIPATIDGKSIEMATIIPITFVLE